MSIGAELARLDATAQADLVRQQEVSALELVDAAIATIERLDGHLNAVIYRRFERARAEAMTPKEGPFAGVPFLVKDLIAHSHGDPFHEGIRGVATQEYRARADTALIRRFRDAGQICVGRTNTPELRAGPDYGAGALRAHQKSLGRHAVARRLQRRIGRGRRVPDGFGRARQRRRRLHPRSRLVLRARGVEAHAWSSVAGPGLRRPPGASCTNTS